MSYQDRLANFVRSQRFTLLLYVLCGLVVAIAVFAAGIAVGYRKAEFAAHWGANYNRNFGGPGNSFGVGGRMPNPHGTSGKVVSIAASTLTIAGQNQQEQQVLVTKDTIIRDRESAISLSSLQVGSMVVVLGAPNANGEIEAQLIRVLAPQQNMTASSTMPQP